MIPYRSLTDRLRTQHEAIERILQHTSEDLIVRAPAPGQWSIKDIIAHLARYQEMFIDRIHRISKGDVPVLESYEAGKDPLFPEWQQWPLPSLLDRLYEDRRLLIRTLEGFACRQTEAMCIHERFGKLSGTECTEYFLLHEAHHLLNIFQLAHRNPTLE